ncbi:MAG TPA: A/G-specific adenine glycosylase [Luteolibacter sp.]|nr:A/G-specific adenine glycosylase [Luteolibacter sp.]
MIFAASGLDLQLVLPDIRNFHAPGAMVPPVGPGLKKQDSLGGGAGGDEDPGVLKPVFKTDAIDGRLEFRDSLADWFLKNGKDYPWRRTSDPYAVLVSEVMLQQTQIATVLGKGFFNRFLERFADVETLARAGDEVLLKTWEGLGYYRRARMLRETAKAVLERHEGAFPKETDELMALPGIGRYTANAVRAFAFDLPSAVVDGNVSRVVSRLMDHRGAVDETDGIRKIWNWTEALADPERPRVFNSALMELGQTICRPGVPDCLSCPVAGFCRTREPESLPVKRKKTAVTEVAEHAIWLRDKKGRVLMHREAGKRRQGLWRLPLKTEDEVKGLPMKYRSRYTITRYRVTLEIWDAGVAGKGIGITSGDEWKEITELASLPMPSPFRRAIDEMTADIQNGM